MAVGGAWPLAAAPGPLTCGGAVRVAGWKGNATENWKAHLGCPATS